MKEYEEVFGLVKELKTYTEECADSFQEYCDILIALIRYQDHMDDNLHELVIEEIEKAIRIYEADYEWVEHEETIVKKYKTLEMK